MWSRTFIQPSLPTARRLLASGAQKQPVAAHFHGTAAHPLRNVRPDPVAVPGHHRSIFKAVVATAPTWLAPVRRAQGTQAAAPAALRMPEVCLSLLSTAKTLWLAPHATDWRASAPAGVSFLPTTISRAELIAAIQQNRPDILVVGDVRMDADVLQAWQAVTPHPKLVRRGTSTDLIDLQACRELGVEVRNEPGLNAPFVARFMLDRLRGPDGSVPDDVRVLGAGEVGRSLIRQYLAERPEGRVTVLVREGRCLEDLRLPPGLAGRVRLTTDWDEALGGAPAVAVCTATNDSTRDRITVRHIGQLAPGSRIACVAKPDCFSSAALRRLARGDATLALDYGLPTLNQFRERLGAMGLAPGGWCALSNQAVADPACRQLLDHAAVVMAATMHLDQMVRRLLAGPAPTLRTTPPDATAPAVAVLGAGVNGLMQVFFAVALLGARATVYGRSAPGAGASHNGVNIRHCSPTETTLNRAPDEAVAPYQARLVIALNCAGITLWKWLLAHNPALRACAQEGLTRLYPTGNPAGNDASLRQQVAIASAPFPGADRAEPARRLSSDDVLARTGIPGMSEGLLHSGLYLWLSDMMAAMRALLQQAGVTFEERHLSAAEQQALAARGELVVGAMGVEQANTVPVHGWFVKLKAANGERHATGVKLHHALPVGVMNCGTDPRGSTGELLVSGGFATDDLSPPEREAIRQGVLAAVERHFPASYARTLQEQGAVPTIDCQRPMGDETGISHVARTSPRRIDAGHTVAAGTTQAPILAAIVTTMLQGLLDLQTSGRAAGDTPVSSPASRPA